MSPSPDVLSNKHATVSVTVETTTLRDGTEIPARFRIASTSGYLASLPACGHDAPIAPCEKPDGHSVPGKAYDRDEHYRTHCHGWHDVSVRRFAEEVLATYGAKRKPIGTVGVPRGCYWDRDFVPLRELVSA